jgi:antitoxin HigA-1
MPTKSASKTLTRDSHWLGPAIPPGEILREEYLKPLGVGQVQAAKRLGISLNRLNEIVLGKRSITADTALRLGRFLKTSPQLWMRLQADWDLYQAMQREARKAVLTCRLALPRRLVRQS